MKITISNHPFKIEITTNTVAQDLRHSVSKLTDEQKGQLLSVAGLIMSVVDIEKETEGAESGNSE